MATQRKSQQARKVTEASDRLFSELAAQTFGVLGWKQVNHRGGDVWSVQDNVLSGDARELRLTIVNDSTRRSDARGLQLGRDILFDGTALGHYLSSAAAGEPTGQITLRKQGRKVQQLAPDNLAAIDRLLIESAPGKPRLALLKWLDSRFRFRSLRDARLLCVPLLFRAGDVSEGRLLQEVVLALERNLLFRYSQLVVPLIRTGYIALLIDGIEAWAEGGRLDPNHGSLGSFLRLVGPSGRFVLTCDRRHVVHESAPPDFRSEYLLPVGKRFFHNPTVSLVSYDVPQKPSIQQDVNSWLTAFNKSGFFGRTERQRLLDALVMETVKLGGGAVPTSTAMEIALEVLPEGWRLLPYATEALDTLRHQPFCRYDRTTGFRFESDGDHEELCVDWMVRRFVQDPNIETILGFADIPARVLRAFVGRLGRERDRFLLALERYLGMGEPKNDQRATALGNGLKSLIQLRQEVEEERAFPWPEAVSLKGASNLARLLLNGSHDQPLTLKNWDFSACNLFQASFFDVHFTRCRFDAAYLAASQFVGCVLEDCSLRGADLTGSRFVDLVLTGSNSLADTTFWSSVFEFHNVPQLSGEMFADADTRNTKGLAARDASDSTDLPGLRRAIAELESGGATVYPSHRYAVSWQNGLEFRRLTENGCQCRYVVPDLDAPEQVQAYDVEGTLLVAALAANRVHIFRWDGTEKPPEVTRPQSDANALGIAPTGEVAVDAGGKLNLFEPGIEVPMEREVLGTVTCLYPISIGSSQLRRLGTIVGTKDGRVDLLGPAEPGRGELIGRTVGFGPPVSISPFDVGSSGADRFVVIWADNAIEIVDPGAKEFSILRVNTAFKHVHSVTADARRQTAVIVGRYSEDSKVDRHRGAHTSHASAQGDIGCALLDLKWRQLLEYWEPELPAKADLDAWVGSVPAAAPTNRRTALTANELAAGLVAWNADVVREMLGPETLKIDLTPTAIVAGQSSIVSLALASAVPLHDIYVDRGTDDERRQFRFSVTMALVGRATSRRVDKTEFKCDSTPNGLNLVCEIEPLEEDDYSVEVAVALAGVQYTYQLTSSLKVRSKNPFQGSGTALPAGSVRYFGREVPLALAVDRLESQCVGVRGSSHSGKTSFLLQLIARLTTRLDDAATLPLIPALVNLAHARADPVSGTVTPITSARVLAQALSDMKRRYSWYPRLSENLDSLVTREVEWATLLNHELERLLRPGAIFVLVLDEFGYVWESSQLAGALHGLSAHIRIVAAGLPVNFKKPENDFSGSGVETIFSVPVSLGPLPETEARRLIKEPLGTYWRMDPDVVDEAILRSSRMPHDLQALMQRALELADSEGTTTISAEHIRQAFELIVEQYERFDGAWEKLSASARTALANLLGNQPMLRLAKGSIRLEIDVDPLLDVGLADYEAAAGESLYLPCGYVERLRRRNLI
jgi:hypothetical protein